MTYNEPELIEMGSAEELVQIVNTPVTVENFFPYDPTKSPSEVYISEF